jgi:methyl-accepting chemotaxis protein
MKNQKLNEHVENQGSNISIREASEVGQEGLQGVAADIQEIARKSEDLLKINLVMKDIASQTNLLSMNVAIKAAHAGEAGKGFAVVVDEIRELAESSSEQSKTIGAVLKNIKASIDKTTLSTREASEVGRDGLQGVAADIQEIARKSEDLLKINLVMKDITSQINLLSMNVAIEAAHAGEAGKGFAVVADEIRELAESSIEQSKIIGSVLKNIKASIDKITLSTENVLNGAVHHVNENRERIGSLTQEVSRFKVA